MKVFFNTYPAAFQCPGGGEIQLLKSKEALERRGHEVILFNQWHHKITDADVVHQFSVQGGIYNLCSYVHGSRIPLVLSPILWLSEYIDQYPMGEIRYLTSVADIICPNSYAEVERFLQHFEAPKDKYVVTHNGVDACFFDLVAPDIFLRKFQIQTPFVLSVANIELRKNQLALLEACNRLGIHAVLVGHIRDQSYFDQINTAFVGKFTYIGYLDHDSQVLRSAYAACAAFVLPSLLETPGLAALEAAAIGAPLVITQEGCTEEYFGESAYYVNPTSVDDIAEKIQFAINSTTIRGLNIKKISQFTWDNVAKELESAYIQARNKASNRL